MIVGEARTTLSASPAEVLEFILDLDRYREADHKIGRVGEVHRDGDVGTAEFAGSLRGLPGMMGTYPFRLTPTSITFGSPIAGPARFFLDFEGSFDCEVTSAGTVVTHREAFDFKAPLRYLAEPAFRGWLQDDITEEMVRFKHLIEGGRPSRRA
jgi:hypothetical protein